MKYLYKTHAVYDEVDLKDEGLKIKQVDGFMVFVLLISLVSMEQ